MVENVVRVDILIKPEEMRQPSWKSVARTSNAYTEA